MRVIFAVLFIFCAFTILSSESKKLKKITKDVGRPRPKDINERLYCRACQLMTLEVLKKIGESRKEMDIYSALPNMCFRLWGHPTQPPQDILKACWALIDGREDMIAQILMERESNEQAIDFLCDTITKACEGVQLKAPGMMVNNPNQSSGQSTNKPETKTETKTEKKDDTVNIEL